MNISFIVLDGVILFAILCIMYIMITIVKPYLTTKNEIKNKEIKNKKYELFMNISPEAMEESIDNYFEKYINRYITYKFIATKQIYIKKEEINTMVNDLTKLILIEMSELYLFYISMTREISSDDDLINYVHSKVMTKCVEAVSNYNGSMS